MPVFEIAWQWLLKNGIEVVAVICGLLYVYYTIRENKILWIYGIISSALYIYVFLHSGIYAYSLLYIYYVIIGFYGWYNWSEKKSVGQSNKPLSIQRAGSGKISLFIVATVIIVVPVFLLLRKYTTSDMALTDALLTSGGMVATWMLTQKYIEQWIFWIVIDIVSCAVMVYKELYPSTILFLAYTLLAVKGYIEWKKELTRTSDQ